MHEENKMDPSSLVRSHQSQTPKIDESSFQSRFYSAFQSDKLITADDWPFYKQKFAKLNTRFKLDGTKLTIGCRLRDLISYGPAFPQFFAFLKYQIFGYALMSVIFAAPALYINYQATLKCALPECTDKSFFKNLSNYALVKLAETQPSDTFYFKEETIVFYSSAVIIALYAYFVFYKLRAFLKKCMENVAMPSDYALLVHGFPEPILEPMVTEFFKENFPEVVIHSIVAIPSFNIQNTGPDHVGTFVLILETHAHQVFLLKKFHADKGYLLQACYEAPKYRDYPLWVARSPDPQDLLVDNFGLPWEKVLLKNLLFIGFMLLLVVISCIVQIYIRRYSVLPRVWFGLIAVIMTKVFILLCRISYKSTVPHTNTSLASKFAWVAGVAQFIMLAFPPFSDYLSDAKPDDNAFEIYQELMINVAFQMLTHLGFAMINITYWVKKIERSDIESSIATEIFTFSHLKRIFQNPEFHIEEFYSIILSLAFLIAVVGPQNPIVYPFVMLSMFVYYWVLKRHFIHYTLTPVKYSAKLVENVVNFMFIVPLLMLGGFRLYMLKFAKPSQIIKDSDMKWIFFMAGLPVVMVIGYVLIRYKKNIDYKARKKLRDLKYTEAKEKFIDNFKVDYEVAINSLLDFRLEIKSFS